MGISRTLYYPRIKSHSLTINDWAPSLRLRESTSHWTSILHGIPDTPGAPEGVGVL